MHRDVIPRASHGLSIREIRNWVIADEPRYVVVIMGKRRYGHRDASRTTKVRHEDVMVFMSTSLDIGTVKVQVQLRPSPS